MVKLCHIFFKKRYIIPLRRHFSYFLLDAGSFYNCKSVQHLVLFIYHTFKDSTWTSVKIWQTRNFCERNYSIWPRCIWPMCYTLGRQRSFSYWFTCSLFLTKATAAEWMESLSFFQRTHEATWLTMNRSAIKWWVLNSKGNK